MMTSFTVEGANALKLHLVCWKTDKPPVGIVQISHGMAEHILRYERFAKVLNEQGYWVYGHDHRGHGQSINGEVPLGTLGAKNGWQLLVNDLSTVTEIIKKEHPKTPLIMFGHSMGSFALRDYLSAYGHWINGAIICGTGDQPELLLRLGIIAARIESLLFGRNHPSKLLTKLSFGNYNDKFSPVKTAFDWLATNEAEVQKYIQDPLCGSTFSDGFYVDFLTGILNIKNNEQMGRFPRDMNYLLLSGMDDPLSENGEVLNRIYNRYKSNGVLNIEKHVFPNMRHELINEIHASEVEKVIISWMGKI